MSGDPGAAAAGRHAGIAALRRTASRLGGAPPVPRGLLAAEEPLAGLTRLVLPLLEFAPFAVLPAVDLAGGTAGGTAATPRTAGAEPRRVRPGSGSAPAPATRGGGMRHGRGASPASPSAAPGAGDGAGDRLAPVISLARASGDRRRPRAAGGAGEHGGDGPGAPGSESGRGAAAAQRLDPSRRARHEGPVAGSPSSTRREAEARNPLRRAGRAAPPPRPMPALTTQPDGSTPASRSGIRTRGSRRPPSPDRTPLEAAGGPGAAGFALLKSLADELLRRRSGPAADPAGAAAGSSSAGDRARRAAPHAVSPAPLERLAAGDRRPDEPLDDRAAGRDPDPAALPAAAEPPQRAAAPLLDSAALAERVAEQIQEALAEQARLHGVELP